MSANELIERLGPHLSHMGMSAAQASQWLRDAALNVERARNSAAVGHLAGWEHSLMRSSADLLASQAAEIERLRGALAEILGPLNVCSDNPHIGDEVCLPVDITMGELRRARQALKGTGADHG